MQGITYKKAAKYPEKLTKLAFEYNNRGKEEIDTETLQEDQIDEGLGILLAHALHNDGHRILRVMFDALEDSNFHSENFVIEALQDDKKRIPLIKLAISMCDNSVVKEYWEKVWKDE